MRTVWTNLKVRMFFLVKKWWHVNWWQTSFWTSINCPNKRKSGENSRDYAHGPLSKTRISWSSVQWIWTNDLGMKKVAVKVVPQVLPTIRKNVELKHVLLWKNSPKLIQISSRILLLVMSHITMVTTQKNSTVKAIQDFIVLVVVKSNIKTKVICIF